MVGIGPTELLILLLTGSSFMSLPVGLPPGPEDPVLHRIATDDSLLYFSWSGMAEADAASSNQTDKLLAEPEVQKLVARVNALLNDMVKGRQPADVPPREAPETALKLARFIATHPTAIVVDSVEGASIRGGFVCNTGDDTAQVRQWLLSLHADAVARQGLPGATPGPEEIKIGNSTWFQSKFGPSMPPLVWRAAGRYLIVGVGRKSAEQISSRGLMQPPAWLSKLATDLPVGRRRTLLHINAAGVVKLAGTLSPFIPLFVKPLGLANLESIDAASGFDANGIVDRARIAFSGPPEGVLDVLSGEAIQVEDVSLVPARTNFAVFVRLSPEKILKQGLAIAGPGGEAALDEVVAEIEQETGVNIRQDVLPAFDGRLLLFDDGGKIPLFGMSAFAGTSDREKLKALEAKLVAILEKEFAREQEREAEAENEAGFRRRPRAPKLVSSVYRNQKIYTIDLRGNDAPFAPSWCVMENGLVGSFFPQNIRDYLDRGPDNGGPDNGGPANEGVVHSALRTMLAGEGNTPFVCWQNTGSQVELLHAAALVFVSLMQRDMADLPFKFEVDSIPSLPAIAQHARFATSSLRREGTALHWEAHSTIPLSGSVLSLPLIGFGGMTRSSREFEDTAVEATTAAERPDIKVEPIPDDAPIPREPELQPQP